MGTSIDPAMHLDIGDLNARAKDKHALMYGRLQRT